MTGIATAFLVIGTVQRIGDASLWENGWFRTGFGMAVVGMCAVLWSVVLFMAHRHVGKHGSALPQQGETLADDIAQVTDLDWARPVLQEQLARPAEFVAVTHGALAVPLFLDGDSPRVSFGFSIRSSLVLPISVESLKGNLKFDGVRLQPGPEIEIPEAPVPIECGQVKALQVQQWLTGNHAEAVRASESPVFDARGLAFRCSFADSGTGEQRIFDVPVAMPRVEIHS